MSSLSDLPEVVGFFSYSREDDEAFKGSLSALRDGIQRELSAQLGRTKRNFRLWQDQEAIAPGRLWETEIKSAVEQAVFFVPIVTPRAVNSENCQIEYRAFLDRERDLGRTDLVFPILYIGVPALENEAQWRNHPVLSVVGKRQYVDWRQFRHHDIQTTAVREAIERFCGKIVEALNRHWLSPAEAAEAEKRLEVLRVQQEAEARQAAEEEARRSKDEAEARRIAEQRRVADAQAERRLQDEKAREAEAESQRRADEEAQCKKDEAEAKRIAEDNRQQQAEARIDEEQAQQRAEAERLAQEEEGRIRSAEAVRLAQEETQTKKPVSDAVAPSDKEGLRPILTVVSLAAIAAIVGIAVWLVERPPATPGDTCYKDIGGGNYSAAVAACTQAIGLDPKSDIAYSNRCIAYINVGNYSAAFADCNQAITLNPKNEYAYANRCISNYDVGHYKAGVADCNQAIALNPKDNTSYDNRAVNYEKLGENAEAIADYQKALTIDPSDRYAKDALNRLGASLTAPGGR